MLSENIVRVPPGKVQQEKITWKWKCEIWKYQYEKMQPKKTLTWYECSMGAA